jgi:hypothetical protein
MPLYARWSDAASVPSHQRDIADARRVYLFESRSLDFQRSRNVTLSGKVWPDALHTTTGRDSASVRSLSREVLESDFVDRTRPIKLPSALLSLVHDRTRRSREWLDAPVANPSVPLRAQLLPLTGRAGRAETASGPVSGHPVTFFRLRFFAFGAVKNRHFTSTKALNPASQARWEGERNSNPSLPLKLYLLCKCANTNKWSSSCARVLAFSQSFSSKELGTH